jgi:hypothetical protein
MADSIFKNRRRRRAFWLFLPLLLILYLLLFPRPGGMESVLVPVWASDLAPGKAVPAEAGAPWYFRAAEDFGYADLQGNLYYVGHILHGLTITDEGFINYGTVPDHVVFMNPRGEFQFSLRNYGYPLLGAGGQTLYSINTDRGGIKRVDREGEILWSKIFPTVLTTIAPAGEECLLGLMDGRALLIGPGGEVVYEYSPGGSRIPVVMGAAVSDARDRIALISGIDPQVLTIVERRPEEFSPEYTRTLESDFRREVRLSFTPDSRFLFYEIDGGLGVLDVRKKGGGGFPEQGILQSIDSGSEFTAAVFRRSQGSKLLIFQPPDSVMFAGEAPAREVFVKILGGSLILGFEGALLRADLLEE